MTHRAYLKITGKDQKTFKGECTRKGREDWTEVQFNFGSEFSVDPNTGKPKGSRTREPLTFIKEHGNASANILQAHFREENIEEAILETCIRGEDGKSEVVATRFTLKDGYLPSYGAYPSVADERRSDPRHLEKFSLSYGEITYENLIAKNATHDNWKEPNAA